MLSQSISTSSSSGGDSQNNLLPKPHSHAYPFFHAAGLYGIKVLCARSSVGRCSLRAAPVAGLAPCAAGAAARAGGSRTCACPCVHTGPLGERHNTTTLQLLLHPCVCKPDEEYFAMITNNWWCASLTLVLQGLNNRLLCASKVEL